MERPKIQIPIKAPLAAAMLLISIFQPEALTVDSSASTLVKARALLSKDKNKEALECLNALLRHEPNNGQAHEERAKAYEGLGYFSKAIDDLTTAIKIHPGNADLYALRADYFYYVDRTEHSITDCKKAMSLNPSLPKAYYVAGKAYASLGMYQKAFEAQTRLVKLKPNRPYAWGELSLISETLGKYDEAIVDRHKAIELSEPEDIAYLQLDSPFTNYSASHQKSQREFVQKVVKVHPIVLPLRSEPGFHMYVPAEVNGHRVQLMLDTGCNYSDLWKQAMPAIGKSEAVILQQTKPTGEATSSRYFRAREFKLGNLVLRDIPLKIDDGLVGDKIMSGFLGGNILENFAVTIDYQNKQVTMRIDGPPKCSDKATVAPMVVRGQHAYCKVTLDGTKDVMAFLDTGSPRNMSADSLLNPELTKHLKYSNHIDGPFLGSYDSERVQLKSITIGTVKFEDPIFDVFRESQAPTEAASITLGNGFLSNFKSVTFDYPGRKLICEPKDARAKSPIDLYNEGKYYDEHAQYQKAIGAFSGAIKADDTMTEDCLYCRALAFLHNKQPMQAMNDFTSLIKLFPNDAAEYYYWRANIHYDLKQYDGQIADDTSAIRLDPSNVDFYANRAEAYHLIGKHDEANVDRLRVRTLEAEKKRRI